MLLLPRETSKRLRGAMRGGLRSLSPVPGAGMRSRDELYCDAGQTAGSGLPGVAFCPLHMRPAWNSSSAVRLLRSMAGWPLRVVEVESQALLGSLERGL